MEPTVYVTVNQDFTLLETVYLPPPSPPPPPPPPATESPPPPAEPEQPPPEEAKTTKEAPWFPIYHMHN
ncbi:hypothetical protein IW147_003867 [Coemansia sp. RSA 720]|nr:hypothetical protein IW147_003867 [Coemansia sp. RSA 720]